MPSILSSEHCARVTTWDANRRELQKSKKFSNRTKVICFIGFNIVIWLLFLTPLLPA